MSDSDNTIPAGFRVIPGFPRYAINESGTTVLSICHRTGRGKDKSWENASRLTSVKTKDGYYRVPFAGISRRMSVHTLVLLTFVGPCPDGMQCRHLDGNPANNNISNLAWGTIAENHRDKILHGTSGKGETHSRAKLTAANVLEIRSRAASGEMLLDIAKDFPVTDTCICRIVRRKSWKHI